jgi:quinoprotein glucose dehydrogenase
MQGITPDDLIDFTPELRQSALQILDDYEYGPLFTPPLHRDNNLGKRGALVCPGGGGGTNIPGGASVDPETGVLYVESVKSCSSPHLVPGSEVDGDDPNPIGKTVMTLVSMTGGGGPRIEGLPIVKPPYGRITAIDLNTGDTLWWIPNGFTPQRFLDHPLLQGVDLPNTGQPTHATTLLSKTLLMYGEGRGGRPLFHAVDKRTGEHVATVPLPAPSNTAPLSYLHEGRQYIVIPIGTRGYPGSLIALALP